MQDIEVTDWSRQPECLLLFSIKRRRPGVKIIQTCMGVARSKLTNSIVLLVDFKHEPLERGDDVMSSAGKLKWRMKQYMTPCNTGQYCRVLCVCSSASSIAFIFLNHCGRSEITRSSFGQFLDAASTSYQTVTSCSTGLSGNWCQKATSWLWSDPSLLGCHQTQWSLWGAG